MVRNAVSGRANVRSAAYKSSYAKGAEQLDTSSRPTPLIRYARKSESEEHRATLEREMKQTVNYADLPTEAAKDAAALIDLENWLSIRQFTAFVDTANDHHSYEFVANAFNMFAGVTGRPVEAFGRKYMLERYIAWARERGLTVDERGFAI